MTETEADASHVDTSAKAGDAPKDAPPQPETEKNGTARPPEIGGPKGPEPTRYGDWEQNGRCTDF